MTGSGSEEKNKNDFINTMKFYNRIDIIKWYRWEQKNATFKKCNKNEIHLRKTYIWNANMVFSKKDVNKQPLTFRK